MYDKFIKNTILLTKNQEYVSQKYEKSNFSTKYRISAQNRIRPWFSDFLTFSNAEVKCDLLTE